MLLFSLMVLMIDLAQRLSWSLMCLVRWWLELESSLRLPQMLVWSWLSARTSLGPVIWNTSTWPLLVIWIFSKHGGLVPRMNNPREPWEKCIILLWSILESQITLLVLFSQDCEIQGEGTSIPKHLDERRYQHRVVKWGAGDLILENTICHNHQCTWDVSEEG